jgi:PPP family 3-phenylpropionic acid transporter
VDRLPLATWWFLFMGGLGAVFPFFSLYFRENAGLTGIQVGIVLGMIPLVGFAAQPFWGQVADRTGSRSRILALVSFGAGASYFLVPTVQGFLPVLLSMALVSSFSTAVIPMGTSVTLALLGRAGMRDFGRIRVWGTVGFLALVVSFPLTLHTTQAWTGLTSAGDGASEPLLGIMFVMAGGLWILSGGFALVLPRSGEIALRASQGEWRELFRHRPFRRVLLFAFGSYLCFQGPMMLFPVYVRSFGGDVSLVSALWIPMLALEIPLLVASGASLERFGARGLIAVGILAGAVRWIACALSTSPWVFFPAQLLHGVTVAGVVIGAPLYVEQSIPEQLRSTGQGVLAMLGFGLGGVISNVASGALLDRFGAGAPALVGGLGGLGLFLLLPLLLPPPSRKS